jgi:type 1 fimbria pilin
MTAALRKCSIALMLAAMSPVAAAQSDSFSLTGTIQAASCDWDIGGGDRTIQLDTIYQGKLPASGGAGFTPFMLNLKSCAPGTSTATFTFSGNAVPGDPMRYRNLGDASGVALELQSADGSTIGANGVQNTRTVAVADGNAVLPLQVGYWRLAGQAVTPGAVSTVATVTLGYN